MAALDVNRLRRQLVVETGSMNGSKTENAIRYCQNVAEHTPYRVLAFTNNVNTRDGENRIVSNGTLEFPATQIDVARPEQITAAVDAEDMHGFVDVIVVDEGNFYDYKLIPILERLRAQDRVVVVTGLDFDFRGESFRPMNRVIELAHVVNRNHPYCKIQRERQQCSNLARYTVRVRKDSPHKVEFYDKEGQLVEGFGFAPYFDPTILAEGSQEGVEYTVACENCFQVPRKEDVATVEDALLVGEISQEIQNLDRILEFLLKEKRWKKEGERLVPFPHRYDTSSGMFVPYD